MKQIMKLQRITQTALLGAVIALPATLSAQDAVIVAQDKVDKVVEYTEAVPAAARQQILPSSRSVLVEKNRGGSYGNAGPATSNTSYESSPAQNRNLARPGSIGAMVGRQNRQPKQVILNNQLQQAVNALHKAKTEAEKAGAKKLLKAELSQQFAADMKRRRDELQAIQQRVAKMEAMLQKRQDSKDEIVGLRLQTLVNNAEGLGWSTGPNNSSGLPATWPNASRYNATGAAPRQADGTWGPPANHLQPTQPLAPPALKASSPMPFLGNEAPRPSLFGGKVVPAPAVRPSLVPAPSRNSPSMNDVGPSSN